jgi:hypothetical protein
MFWQNLGKVCLGKARRTTLKALAISLALVIVLILALAALRYLLGTVFFIIDVFIIDVW